MRLTAKLAYSQVKINRSRTVWTLLGIVLSTALITAVCSFAASGNKLIASLYGAEYGSNLGESAALILIPAGFLSAVIVSMSVIVISNAFRVSAGERRAQFGALKSVGATKRQITETVMAESILLSVVGIPVGIVIGLILAFAGVLVANSFLGDINSLVHMMMNELIIVFDFVITWQSIAAAVLISFFAVLFSAWLPARKAAKIAAIDSIRGTSEIIIDVKQVRTGRLTQKLFGFEGALAAKNMKRNRRNFRASVVSLTIGVVLFINLSALSEQAGQMEDMMFPNIDATVTVDYTSFISRDINETTGKRESRVAKPVHSAVAEMVTEKFREYDVAGIFCIGDDKETYSALVPGELISPRLREVLPSGENQQEYELSVDIMTVDGENYAALCEKAGVPIGSNILLNNYSHNDNGRLDIFEPFLFEKQTLRLMKADNSISEIPIHGILTQEDMPGELYAVNVNIVRIIIPEGEMRGYTWYSDPADIDGFIAYANVIMYEVFPQGQDAAYMATGFTTRVFRIQDYMKVMNIAIVLAEGFIYSFAALLMLIGLTNVISTMSANVRMRSKEFAILQSVGMTNGGLKRMLNLESIMCSAKSLLIGLPLAIVLTYLINMPIRAMLPIPYHFPWLASICCIAIVFAITWVTMRYAASRLRGGNIVETIRSESGM